MGAILKQHKILSTIADHERSSALSPALLTDVAKGLSVKQLHDKTSYKTYDLEVFCNGLVSEGLLKPVRYTQNNELYYCITDLGKKFNIEKTLLKRLWYRNWSFWFSLVALIISILSFFYKK